MLEIWKYRPFVSEFWNDFKNNHDKQFVDPISLYLTLNPNHSYLSQLDVTYKTPDLMSHFLPPH
ncbi:hypothetical protein, partial [Streptococcus pneumoniae]|uniref:hypothetical protein n=3 Tax=Streptococcus pneumoniae TaxID=1313 RepID=UPI00124373CE